METIRIRQHRSRGRLARGVRSVARRLRSAPRGFTLVETLMILLITGMLLAVALPDFLTYGRRDRVETAAQDLAARVRLARQKALARRTAYRVDFSQAGGSYEIRRRVFNGGETWVRDPDETILLPSGVGLWLNLGGQPDNTDLVLEPQGTVKAEDAPAVIRIMGERDTMTLSVVRTGRVRVARGS